MCVYRHEQKKVLSGESSGNVRGPISCRPWFRVGIGSVGAALLVVLLSPAPQFQPSQLKRHMQGPRRDTAIQWQPQLAKANNLDHSLLLLIYTPSASTHPAVREVSASMGEAGFPQRKLTTTQTVKCRYISHPSCRTTSSRHDTTVQKHEKRIHDKE